MFIHNNYFYCHGFLPSQNNQLNFQTLHLFLLVEFIFFPLLLDDLQLFYNEIISATFSFSITFISSLHLANFPFKKALKFWAQLFQCSTNVVTFLNSILEYFNSNFKLLIPSTSWDRTWTCYNNHAILSFQFLHANSFPLGSHFSMPPPSLFNGKSLSLSFNELNNLSKQCSFSLNY